MQCSDIARQYGRLLDAFESIESGDHVFGEDLDTRDLKLATPVKRVQDAIESAMHHWNVLDTTYTSDRSVTSVPHKFNIFQPSSNVPTELHHHNIPEANKTDYVVKLSKIFESIPSLREAVDSEKSCELQTSKLKTLCDEKLVSEDARSLLLRGFERGAFSKGVYSKKNIDDSGGEGSGSIGRSSQCLSASFEVLGLEKVLIEIDVSKKKSLADLAQTIKSNVDTESCSEVPLDNSESLRSLNISGFMIVNGGFYIQQDPLAPACNRKAALVQIKRFLSSQCPYVVEKLPFGRSSITSSGKMGLSQGNVRRDIPDGKTYLSGGLQFELQEDTVVAWTNPDYMALYGTGSARDKAAVSRSIYTDVLANASLMHTPAATLVKAQAEIASAFESLDERESNMATHTAQQSNTAQNVIPDNGGATANVQQTGGNGRKRRRDEDSELVFGTSSATNSQPDSSRGNQGHTGSHRISDAHGQGANPKMSQRKQPCAHLKGKKKPPDSTGVAFDPIKEALVAAVLQKQALKQAGMKDHIYRASTADFQSTGDLLDSVEIQNPSSSTDPPTELSDTNVNLPKNPEGHMPATGNTLRTQQSQVVPQSQRPGANQPKFKWSHYLDVQIGKHVDVHLMKECCVLDCVPFELGGRYPYIFIESEESSDRDGVSADAVPGAPISDTSDGDRDGEPTAWVCWISPFDMSFRRTAQSPTPTPHILTDHVDIPHSSASPNDYPSTSSEPSSTPSPGIRVFQRQPKRVRKCSVCTIWAADRLVVGDRLADKYTVYYCAACFDMLHYGPEGDLLYDDFEVFSYPFVSK